MAVYGSTPPHGVTAAPRRRRVAIVTAAALLTASLCAWPQARRDAPRLAASVKAWGPCRARYGGWMSLHAHKKINEFTLLGSHDAGTYTDDPNAESGWRVQREIMVRVLRLRHPAPWAPLSAPEP